MELPHIGEHCSEVACRQLDFLPFTCSHCKKIFCLQHHKVANHHCTEARLVDVQVPVCPLCDQAVPAPRGQPPDIAISQHLDNNCKVKKEKIFTNKCCYRGCKKKEMMPIECRDCGLNFCLSHRHPNDHTCSKVRRISSTANTSAQDNFPSHGSFLQSLRDQAAARFGPNPFTAVNSSSSHTSGGVSAAAVSRIQAGMSEDEALARALAESEQQVRVATTTAPSSSSPATPADDDLLLQQAIAASLRDTRASQRRSSQDCRLL
ncbi:hypothetical protein HAZT_HAZT008240 [Hyalella azteca]|uniref:AN1-type zinc finger protein 2A n=1 Tax=Hyalella azteca TaxID=294128 RepID=A0A6A0GQA2_HYAAZ|nr:AN1-type zinc finger protein 2A [Hyalella azteca]KAA0184450.1 hypothetical protein HAZT_HAZT008240 [Hyalella azteca]